MEIKAKSMRKNLFALMLSVLMVFSIIIPSVTVFATGNTHNNVITDIKLTKSDLTTPIQQAARSEMMQLLVKFSLPNGTVKEGDITVIDVPKELEIFKSENFPIQNTSGEVIANAVVDHNTKKITLTYTKFVQEHSDVSGSLHVTVLIDQKVVKQKGKLNLTFNLDTNTKFNLDLEYIGIPSENPDEVFNKWCNFDKDDPTTVHCNIRVNKKGGTFNKLIVEDAIQSPKVSYVKTSFKIEKGKWEIPTEGYPYLSGKVDDTNKHKISYNSETGFSIQFDNVKGEGYLISYDMKLAYTPTNQEIIGNKITGKTEQETLTDYVVNTLYQQSGGEANGYNYTIKIHKESEDGKSLSGAIFEVVRDYTQVKVGEITTDGDGNGSLDKLLKDNYTLKEIKAPKDYMLDKSNISITPDDFGTDKAVLKTVKNKVIPKININGQKIWEDGNNRDGKRPASIVVNLLADGISIRELEVKPDEHGKWEYSFKDLNEYTELGEKIKYTVTENKVTDYTTEIIGYDIKNTYLPKETSVTVTKKWEDNKNQDGKRPNSIKVQLYADDEKIGQEVVLKEGSWTYTWNNLPEKKSGKLVKYTVKEVETVKDYVTSYDNADNKNIIITNTHKPEKTSIKVTKVWDDKNNKDNKRPDSIIIKLLADGKEIDGNTLTLNKENKWTGSFENLDKFKSGKKIEYTIKEETVGNGYTSTITGNAQDGYIVTNVRVPDIPKIPRTPSTPQKNLPKTGDQSQVKLYISLMVLSSGILASLLLKKRINE